MVGYTSGLATASFFGDALEGQKRPGQNITVNGKFYKAIDGYMLAGPQWANYMLQGRRILPRHGLPEAAGVHDQPPAGQPPAMTFHDAPVPERGIPIHRVSIGKIFHEGGPIGRR